MRPPPITFLDWATFLVGALTGIKLHVGGDFPYGELLLFVLFPFLLSKYRDRIFRAGNKPLLILMGIWLFGQIISDLVNGSPSDRAAKGFARVVVLAIDFATLSMLIYKNKRRIKSLALGLAIAEALSIRLGGYSEPSLAWKYGYSYSASILALLLGSYYWERRRNAPYLLIVLILAAANLHYGYRSAMAIDFVVLVFTLPIFLSIGGPSQPGKPNLTRIIVLFICCFGVLLLAQKIISFAAKNGYFDEGQTRKFEQQSSGKLGVLIGGRPEIPVDLVAIADRPLLGHGSYPVDRKYTILLQKFQYEYGYSDSAEGADPLQYGIPSHSHILELWVEAGVLGSLFWFYALWLTLYALVKLSINLPPLSPLYLYFFATFFWDILFSPFGSERRLFDSFFLVLIVNLTASLKPPSKVFRNLRSLARRKRKPSVRRAAPGRVAFPGLPRPNTIR